MAVVTRSQNKLDILGFLKTNFWGIALTLYIVLSLFFIARTTYYGVLASAYTTGAQQGYQQAIVQLAEQVGKSSCSPLPVNYGEGKTISVVNATCVGSTPGVSK